MKIIGFESFSGHTKKDNTPFTCLRFYVANDKNDDTHQGLTGVESGMIFNFTKEQALRISRYFDNGTDLFCLYNKRGTLYDVQEISKK